MEYEPDAENDPIPFLFEVIISGRLELTENQISFMAFPCTGNNGGYGQWIFPCNNHLFKNVEIPFPDVQKIRRRNYLFIVPNRMMITMKNGNRYLFATWHRGKIIRTFREFNERL
ncbi:MAG: hypothetical protein LH606_11110 [Cytophagaceae bacterium]|nr:hypothetical protein [Cytophagaceae bacterium]